MNHTKSNLASFLQSSPSAFHACQNIANKFIDEGYIQLIENQDWDIQVGHKYVVTRNDSSVIAFKLSKDFLTQKRLTIIGAHTDSPCLKPKPNAIYESAGYIQCGVETYGGVLLNPWFDRDLSLAGKVVYEDSNGKLMHSLVDIKKPIAIIPSLAIHLDREANKSRTVNAQLHIPPVLSTSASQPDFELRELVKQHLPNKNNISKILDVELNFYDTQAPSWIGLSDDLLASARLDNLMSCFCAMEAMSNSDDSESALIICTDHEEVGSQSHCGAQGTFLSDILARITKDEGTKTQIIQNSVLLSVDNAHAIHPNHKDKHEPNHAPVLGQGIVIKYNANQRYATHSMTSSYIKKLCQENNLNVQDMVVRTDMGCGSTIGPITSGEIGISTVDLGIPQLAMHSIRELAQFDDVLSMVELLTLSINTPYYECFVQN